MRTQLKYPAFFLLASAFVVACASEPDDESIGSIGDVPAESEPNAKHSSDTDEVAREPVPRRQRLQSVSEPGH